jgi:hypothetical protein
MDTMESSYLKQRLIRIAEIEYNLSKITINVFQASTIFQPTINHQLSTVCVQFCRYREGV